VLPSVRESWLKLSPLLSGALDPALVVQRLAEDEIALTTLYPTLAHWPADAQLAMHARAWVFGPGFRSEAFRRHAAALPGPLFLEMAASSRFEPTRGNSAIISVNALLTRTFRNAHAVLEEGLDASRVYYPHSLG
jgi:hypothetical protein